MNTNPVFQTTSNSPISTSDDQWISDLLAKSAPMTTTNSFSNAFNLEMSNFDSFTVPTTDFPSVLENESIFSGLSRASTASSTPPVKEEIDQNELGFGQAKVGLLDSVNTKLQMMQRRNDLTPKALESIFDTKDVLKDTVDGQAGLAPQKQSTQAHRTESSSNQAKKKRCSRRRLTDSQKEAHNKVEKKYRVNINQKINSLQTIIPWFANQEEVHMDLKVNKSVILEKAYDYITYLKAENEALRSRLGETTMETGI